MKLTLAIVLAIFVATSSAVFFRTRSNPSKVVVQSPVQESDLVQVPIDNYFPVTVEAPLQQSQVIAVEPSTQAVHLVFKSVSSPVSVHQEHTPGQRSFYETTRSEEPPHIIRHEVFKPVFQELRETIQPYRHVTQEIRPVIENVKILVPKGQQPNGKFNDHVQRDFVLPLPKFPKLSSIIKPVFPRPIVQQQEQQRFPVQQQEQQGVLVSNEQVSNFQSTPERYTIPIIVEQTQQQRMEDTNDENFD
ncbi:hypothetical protein BLA29_006788 [Euroglyphus maynei]|uniref:DFP2-like protein n=1 Tax=Euroglyphus maynei TaxID=6958 RepID=A0A1Y3AW33_EURMA|nr:hypothetical protein BLA29_006788 [Euroglyphus maynei]